MIIFIASNFINKQTWEEEGNCQFQCKISTITNSWTTHPPPTGLKPCLSTYLLTLETLGSRNWRSGMWSCRNKSSGSRGLWVKMSRRCIMAFICLLLRGTSLGNSWKMHTRRSSNISMKSISEKEWRTSKLLSNSISHDILGSVSCKRCWRRNNYSHKNYENS